jgi:peptide deformylase
MLMPVRPIVRAGDPVLAKVATPVADPAGDDVARLVADMIDTLETVGAAGIAAPQIGVSRRAVIYFVPAHRVTDRADDGPIDVTVLVNPEIHPLGDATWTEWEGCLSLPGLRGRVPRWERIRVVASDLDGARTERVVGGTHARIIQHECDHLDGRLYPSRMVETDSLGFLDELVAAGRIPPRVGVRVRDHVGGALAQRLARL